MVEGFHQAQSSFRHNPYFNRWFSAINDFIKGINTVEKVTILILIDGFLQSHYGYC